jgi:hypothetical protein
LNDVLSHTNSLVNSPKNNGFLSNNGLKQRNTRGKQQEMMPNARQRTDEFKADDRILSIVDPMSLDCELVAFFLSIAPANQQMRLVDVISAYMRMAKDSEHAGINMWANNL